MGSRGEVIARRSRSIVGVGVAAVVLTLMIPIWVPLLALVDLIRGSRRLPRTRLVAFAVGWSWLEVVAMVASGGLWAAGQRNNRAAHYRLQRWWTGRLMSLITATTGKTVEVDGVETLQPGPTVLLGRHASLGDSLVTAWAVSFVGGMRPHFVLKRELLAVPSLDVVGNRLPNHFLDRQATDSAAELDGLRAMSAAMGPGDVAIIFPEGTRASPAKRERALHQISERDPGRAERLGGLRWLLPPRPRGAQALIEGNPDAAVVAMWHTGFDGFDTFGGMIRQLAKPPVPIRLQFIAVDRTTIDAASPAAFDDLWLALDQRVDESMRITGGKR